MKRAVLIAAAAATGAAAVYAYPHAVWWFLRWILVDEEER